MLLTVHGASVWDKDRTWSTGGGGGGGGGGDGGGGGGGDARRASLVENDALALLQSGRVQPQLAAAGGVPAPDAQLPHPALRVA